MLGIIVLMFIFIGLIILLSFISKTLGKKVLYPFTAFLMSIILLLVSFAVGQWEGMGLGAISFSLFIASLISLISIISIATWKRSV